MFTWEAVEKAIDLIESHLLEPISTQRLADHVGLSVFYFQRLFKRLTGKTVQQYVKLRRLAYSVALMEDSHRTILDVALECGFSTHSNYTRAFCECFGITPQTYRREHPALNVLQRPDLSLRYDSAAAQMVATGDSVFEIGMRVLSQPEFYQGYEIIVPMAGQIPGGQATGIDLPGELWRRFHARKTKESYLCEETVELGVCHGADHDSFRYFAGAQVENMLLKPDDLVAFTLVPGEYAVCRIDAPSHTKMVTQGLYRATQYMYDVYLPAAKRLAAAFAAEKYHLPDGGTCCMELWIPLE